MVFHQPDTTKCGCCDDINFGEPAPDCPNCGGTGKPKPVVTDVEAKLAALKDCVAELPVTLLYYDRQEDSEDITQQDVVALQKGGHLTVEMLTEWFAEALRKDWPS